MENIIYGIIAIIATTVGASTGMGGGVIIKPVLDFIGTFDVATIGVLSSISVFVMSIVSVGKQIKSKAEVDFKIAVPLAFGSVFGGIAGNWILDFSLKSANMDMVKIIQNIVLGFIIIIIFFYMQKKDELPTLGLLSVSVSIVTGLILGMLSSFLGIGGGPINVAVFIFIFSFDSKTSAVYSLITIFFSQGAKLLTTALSTGFSHYNLSVLPFMVTASVFGGVIGTEINKKISEKNSVFLFNLVQVIIFIICIVNIFTTIY